MVKIYDSKTGKDVTNKILMRIHRKKLRDSPAYRKLFLKKKMKGGKK